MPGFCHGAGSQESRHSKINHDSFEIVTVADDNSSSSNCHCFVRTLEDSSRASIKQENTHTHKKQQQPS